MMSTRTWWTVIFGLFVLIVLMLGFLIALPTSKPSSTIMAPASSSNATSGNHAAPTTQNDSQTTPPLDAKVMVTTPEAQSHVSHNFTVAGVAPGPWFFEAQFPIQVREGDGNIIGRATGHAQGDWETEKLVTFTANMQIDATFHGNAKLILMKDNPSGMPENDDALEVPIIVD